MNRRTRRLYPNARVNRITFLTFLIGKSRGNVQSCNKHADLFAAIRSLDPIFSPIPRKILCNYRIAGSGNEKTATRPRGNSSRAE